MLTATYLGQKYTENSLLLFHGKLLFVSRFASKVIRQLGWAGTCEKGSAIPNIHSATLYLHFSNCCIELISRLSNNEATQTVNRFKKIMKRIRICTLWLTIVGK